MMPHLPFKCLCKARDADTQRAIDDISRAVGILKFLWEMLISDEDSSCIPLLEEYISTWNGAFYLSPLDYPWDKWCTCFSWDKDYLVRVLLVNKEQLALWGCEPEHPIYKRFLHFNELLQRLAKVSGINIPEESDLFWV